MALRPSARDNVMLALEILKRIPRSGAISAPEIRRELEQMGLKRDLRSIQRQLEDLSANFDIERDTRSKPYGYRWKERAKGFSFPALNDQEALLLALAEQQLKTLLPGAIVKSMESFFAQARNRLTAVQRLSPDHAAIHSREFDWLRKVRVVPNNQPLLPPNIKPEVLESVSNALYTNQWLDVDYNNARGVRMQARVMPLGLAQQGPRMFLVCRFEGYDNERSLALHRMASASATSLPFTPLNDFDLQAYDDDGRFGFGEGERIQLKFRIRKGPGLHVLETPLSEDQTVVELQDHYEITATVVRSAQLVWWLRGFGGGVEVVEPVRLLD